jgi:DNA-binding NarL/FixJ family response regulator
MSLTAEAFRLRQAATLAKKHQALQLLRAGHSVTQVAVALLLDARTVRKWRAALVELTP